MKVNYKYGIEGGMKDRVGINPSHYYYPKSNLVDPQGILANYLVADYQTPDYLLTDKKFSNLKADPSLNIPNKSSTGSAWIEWHKELKNNLGIKAANQLWLKAWNKYGNTFDANTKELREYISANGIKIEGNVFSEAFDFVMAPFDAISSALQMGKYAVIGVGVILIGGLGLMVFNIARNPNKTISTIKR